MILPLLLIHRIERFDKLYALVGALLATAAGVFHLREEDGTAVYHSDAFSFTVVWRKLISSDRLVALFMLSVSVIAIAISVYLAP